MATACTVQTLVETIIKFHRWPSLAMSSQTHTCHRVRQRWRSAIVATDTTCKQIGGFGLPYYGNEMAALLLLDQVFARGGNPGVFEAVDYVVGGVDETLHAIRQATLRPRTQRGARLAVHAQIPTTVSQRVHKLLETLFLRLSLHKPLNIRVLKTFGHGEELRNFTMLNKTRCLTFRQNPTPFSRTTRNGSDLHLGFKNFNGEINKKVVYDNSPYSNSQDISAHIIVK